MSKEKMNTKEAAEYLGIHEKQIYALIKAGKIPCTRVTGKWLFPVDLIDRWILESAQKSNSGEISGESNKILLASGSNDPVLDTLLNFMKHEYPEINIFSSSTGSTEGLNLLNRGLTNIAFCHLFDPETEEYNIPQISSILHNKEIAVVHLFYRELGFLYTDNYKKGINSFNDLKADGLKFINRQTGSGTRVLTDYYLKKNGIISDEINGYDNEVYTHFEVGLSLLSGEADAGIATVAVSKLMGLNFTPIINESFDMVMSQKSFFRKEVQAFIEILNSNEFRKKIRPLGNYDFNESGKIIHTSS